MTVFDCFLFNDEVELLHARLHEMKDMDVQHVLVQQHFTFQGAEKPLHYSGELQTELEAKFDITAVTYRDELYSLEPWKNEDDARSWFDIALVELEAQPDDLILICDGDEIAKSSRLSHILPMTHGGPVQLSCPQHYYDLTTRVDYVGWRTKAVRYRDLEGRGGAAGLANTGTLRNIDDACWHFSCLGGPQKVLDKLVAFSHSELQLTPGWVTLENVTRLIAEKRDLVPPPGNRKLTQVPLDGPAWLLEQLASGRWPYLLNPLGES